MKKRLYVAKWKIDHDGRQYRAGKTLALTPEEAKPLLDTGSIRRAKIDERRQAVSFPTDFPERGRLIEYGILTVDDVQRATDKQLLAIPRIGPKTLHEIREAQAAELARVQ